ncbi:MAG: hypothetical protein PUH42_05115 [Firmicutes bacterium]|nr:hypothetical protein [Clostridiales bacterium]MDD7320426.1 hypothetical protein [Bacillota bacterium]
MSEFNVFSLKYDIGAGHQGLLYFFCQVGARGSRQEIPGNGLRAAWEAIGSSAKNSARLFFAKSLFDEYFKQKREFASAAPKELIFYFPTFKFSSFDGGF